MKAHFGTFGYSSCPNDTFMLDALIHGRGPLRDGPKVESWIADIAALNQRALRGPDPLPWTKLSVAALGACNGRYLALNAGAALGRGVGPLVLFNPKKRPELGQDEGLARLEKLKVAIPGAQTTAALLLKIFGPQNIRPQTMPFEQICGALERGEVDAGVVIHETRFIYQELGLRCLADLGELWEKDTGLALPLGIMAGRADLSPQEHARMSEAIADSLRYARQEPQASASFVAAHAQELSADVTAAHIRLYVNDYSLDLGPEGRAAIEMLLRRGYGSGHSTSSASTLWATP